MNFIKGAKNHIFIRKLAIVPLELVHFSDAIFDNNPIQMIGRVAAVNTGYSPYTHQGIMTSGAVGYVDGSVPAHFPLNDNYQEVCILTKY